MITLKIDYTEEKLLCVEKGFWAASEETDTSQQLVLLID